MNVKGYHHVAVDSNDVEKSVKFYTEGLGGIVVHSFPLGGGKAYLIDIGGGAVVELLPTDKERKEEIANWAHIALASDDARADFALALNAGASIHQEPQDLMIGTMPACIAFVKGPDGEIIEFFQEK